MNDSGQDVLAGAEEQSTAAFRVRVKSLDTHKDEVIVRVDRPKGTGRALYETLYLTHDEADALLIALMNEIG